MACSCKSKASAQALDKAPVSSDPVRQTVAVVSIPHSVLPDESCIFCADKHLSVAYSAYANREPLGHIIGELELARRHTAKEFKSVSSNIAEVEWLFCTRRPDDASAMFPALLDMVYKETEKNDPDTERRGGTYEYEDPVLNNPLVAEVRLCAAARLAAELGYMLLNREMIAGDLVAAAENILKYDYALSEATRDLRHRIFGRRTTDIDPVWEQAMRAFDSKMTDGSLQLAMFHEGLRTYLGLGEKG